MGFFGKLWSGVKEAASEVGAAVAGGVRYAGKKLQEAGEWIDNAISNLGKNENSPTINYPPKNPSSGGTGGNSSTHSANEEERKRERERENKAITEYQNQIEQRAKSRENAVKKAYLKIYNKYISEFAEVFDDDVIKDIRGYVEKESNAFTNTLRDEVNTKVNSSYRPWKQLVSSHPSAKRLQAYCDKVYTEADNNLLDLLQKSIEDTNKYISRCIIKYNEDKAKALSDMKSSLIKLTSDEETKSKELQKIAEELVVAQFIINETSL